MTVNNKVLNGSLIIVTAFLLAVLFLCGFLPRLFQIQKVNDRASENTLPQVTLLVAKPIDLPVELILPSRTQANHITPVWARTNGYVTKFFVDIGDTVKKDQLLALLDTPEVDQQYLQSIQDFEAAKARRDIAKMLAERGQKTFEKNSQAISKEDVDQRTAAFIAAEAELHSFEASMNRYKDLMEFKNITAPFDGTIIERTIDIGSLVTAGSDTATKQLFQIAASDPIRVFVAVPQQFFRSIHEGVEAETKIRQFSNTSFKSSVVRYAKALDETAHTMLTELHIGNKDGTLLPGLYAQVSFSLPPDFPYYVVPTQAIIIRAGDAKVAVVDHHDIVHLKKVEIGLDYGKNMQIIDGIDPNDRIITNPTEKIKDGVHVHVTSMYTS